jgi:probable HAF family extracellular repeat protein
MYELPPLPGHSQSYAWALNDDDIVVGASDGEAVLWEDGIPVALAGLEATNTWEVNAINNHRQVVGWNQNLGGFLWDAGVLTWLGKGVRAEAINDAGQIVGAVGYGGDSKAFVWEDGVLTLLPQLDEVFQLESRAWDINESGQIVGYGHDGQTWRAVLWDAGQVIDITPPTPYVLVAAMATAINDHGVILGLTQDEGPRPNGQAFIYDHGVTVRVEGPTPGEFSSIIGHDLNNSGEIAGTTSPDAGWPSSARAWSRKCFAACCE